MNLTFTMNVIRGMGSLLDLWGRAVLPSQRLLWHVLTRRKMDVFAESLSESLKVTREVEDRLRENSAVKAQLEQLQRLLETMRREVERRDSRVEPEIVLRYRHLIWDKDALKQAWEDVGHELDLATEKVRREAHDELTRGTVGGVAEPNATANVQTPTARRPS